MLSKVIVMVLVINLSGFTSEQKPWVLDGRSFEGKLKAKNTWLRIPVKGSINFVDGQFYWTTGKKGDDYQMGAYQLTKHGAGFRFTARVFEANGSRDYINWQGTFDGQNMSAVTAEWIRIEKDFVHDLMLPDKVIFEFKVKQAQ